jgi:hypothetical protein
LWRTCGAVAARPSAFTTPGLGDKAEFEDMFERAFPPAQPRLPLVIVVDGDAHTDARAEAP